MAPRRGGGGGGGGSSSISASCPGAFQDTIYSTPIPYFVGYCLFFVVFLIIMIAWAKVKKRHTNARKLVGPIYGVSLLFMLIRYALAIIGTMLRECKTTDDNSYYSWFIAWTVFRELGLYLLLVVVFYGVNDLLRNHLGSNPGLFKILYGIVLGIMGVLTAAYLGLECYNLWLLTDDGMDSDQERHIWEELRLAIAYYVLYLIVVIAGGALSIVSIVSMRSRRLNTNGLIGSVIALTFCMFIWVLFYIIDAGSSLSGAFLDTEVYEAFFFIEDAFQAFAWTILLFIAKASALKAPVDNTDPQIYNQPTYAQPTQQQTYAPVPVPQAQQQYAYNNNANGTQYYYQQQPVYNGTPSPVYGNGSGGMVQVK